MNAHVQAPRRNPLGASLARRGYRALIALVVVANLVLAAYAVAVIVPSVVRIELGGQGWVPPAVSPSPSPSPSPTPNAAMSAMGVVMADDVDCRACHSQPGETNARPVMAHPLAGWEDCTACHAPNKLVETAPGHTGIHKDQCLLCHTASSDQSPAPKPHHTYNGTACTSCHGNPQIPQAPLPADMAGRTECWVCHGLTQGNELWDSTAAPVPGTNESPAAGSAKPALSAGSAGSAGSATNGAATTTGAAGTTGAPTPGAAGANDSVIRYQLEPSR